MQDIFRVGTVSGITITDAQHAAGVTVINCFFGRQHLPGYNHVSVHLLSKLFAGLSDFPDNKRPWDSILLPDIRRDSGLFQSFQSCWAFYVYFRIRILRYDFRRPAATVKSENELLRIQLKDINEMIAVREEELTLLRRKADEAASLRSKLENSLLEMDTLQQELGLQQQKAYGSSNREAALETEILEGIRMEKSIMTSATG